jgi:hypothetical protein
VIGFVNYALESRNISHGHPGEVKEILKNLVTILLEFGDMSPLSKARTHPRTPKRLRNSPTPGALRWRARCFEVNSPTS